MYQVSKYNYLIDYKGKKLLFNGMKGAGICMLPSEWSSVEPLFDNLSVFEKEYPDDFDIFKKCGFVIDSDFDELAYLKYKNKVETFNSKDYQLTINPTLECNFHCWYCYEEHRQGHMAPETIESVQLHIKHVLDTKCINTFKLSWFGGEPLLYFDEVVYPISLYAKKLCDEKNIIFSNSATTNAFLIDENMIRKMSEIGMQSFQITLDGNRNRHDKIRNFNGTPSYDRIVRNINMLCAAMPKTNITLRINYDNATFKQNLIEVLGDFSKDIRSRIYIDLHRVWQTYDNEETIKECETGNEDLNHFVCEARNSGYKCHCHGALIVGVYHGCYACKTNYACINYDGRVYKCTARSFSDDDCIGDLQKDGRIIWNEARMSRLYGFSPLENKRCMECKYLPLCMGPCPQHFSENNYEVNCSFEKLERKPQDRIIDLYEQTLSSSKAATP